ncbi:hypothetical protein SD77_2263 [Bacillus badius]|uniref:Uncharacterized protein n=1 Tax=Bacillus badius TaxID=1455 RepID=A0ABR5AYP6_BACBA|nr:hypothetical protein SD78_2275 [Bacillus badius]KIL79809.1 hypothetical protein SD77_2263 [Bacillus badius]
MELVFILSALHFRAERRLNGLVFADSTPCLFIGAVRIGSALSTP